MTSVEEGILNMIYIKDLMSGIDIFKALSSEIRIQILEPAGDQSGPESQRNCQEAESQQRGHYNAYQEAGGERLN